MAFHLLVLPPIITVISSDHFSLFFYSYTLDVPETHTLYYCFSYCFREKSSMFKLFIGPFCPLFEKATSSLRCKGSMLGHMFELMLLNKSVFEENFLPTISFKLHLGMQWLVVIALSNQLKNEAGCDNLEINLN